jgi:hypothetical protein
MKKKTTEESLHHMQASSMAESATGMFAGYDELANMCDEHGNLITVEQARQLLFDAEEPIILPNAGAGTYKKVISEILQADELEVIDWTSSAGDWTLAYKDGDTWYPLFQSNRWPMHGFSYSIDRSCGADTFDELCNIMMG